MAIPRQVKQIEERTEQLVQQQQAASSQPPADAPPADTPPNPEDGQGAPAEGTATPDKERVDWKAKFHTLQGKYNAEVPRLASEIKALMAKVEGLSEANAELRSKAPAATPPEPQVDAAVEALRKEYGDDVVGAIERVAAQRVETAIKPLQERVELTEKERAEKRHREAQADAAREFAEAVEDLIPDWEAIDKLPAFHAYLAEVDASGQTRQTKLMELAGKFDAAGAARIFAAFKRTAEFRASQGTPPPATSSQLASQEVPETSGRERSLQGKKIWTRKEIQVFYKDMALGNIPAERAKETEREIEAAHVEGRVR